MTTLESPTITLRLPRWTPKQLLISSNPAKRKILVAGRRFGKTTFFGRTAVDYFLKGKKVLEAAPVSKQTNAFWRQVKRMTKPLTDAGLARKWENDRILEMGDGIIQAQTAFDADTLRGDWADLLMLDEYSYMDETAWTVVGAPMLLDRDGDALFAFTPNRRNHAYRLYLRALDMPAAWAVFHGTSYDNPHLSRDALTQLIADMSQDMIEQEIMAKFLEDQGAVFRNIAACMNAPTNPERKEHDGHYIVAGLDWGKQNDYTATSIGCADCKVELARDRFNKIDYHYQYGRIAELWKAWVIDSAFVEVNSIGTPGFEALERAELPVVAFETTASSKPPLIENMALAFERAEWQFQADAIWTGEIESYERRISENTGRSQYSAPDGLHDDTVMARALMLRAADNRQWSIY